MFPASLQINQYKFRPSNGEDMKKEIEGFYNNKMKKTVKKDKTKSCLDPCRNSVQTIHPGIMDKLAYWWWTKLFLLIPLSGQSNVNQENNKMSRLIKMELQRTHESRSTQLVFSFKSIKLQQHHLNRNTWYKWNTPYNPQTQMWCQRPAANHQNQHQRIISKQG